MSKAFKLTPAILAVVLDFVVSLPRGTSYIQSQKNVKGIQAILLNELTLCNQRTFENPESVIFEENKFSSKTPGSYNISVICLL